MSKLRRFYLPGVESNRGQQYLTRGKRSKHSYFMCGEFNPNVKAGNLVQWFDDSEVAEIEKSITLTNLMVEIKYPDPLKELTHRLVVDIKNTPEPSENDETTLTDGLKVALFEIEHLNQPFTEIGGRDET